METNKVVRSESNRVIQRLNQTSYQLLLVLTLFTCVLCALVMYEGRVTREAIDKEAPIEQMFDTRVIESWCGGEDLGTIRMVGAWVCSTNQDGTTTLEDEQGNLWYVRGKIDQEAFLLLWLVDNHTPDIEDDEIVKVWCEWYNE